MGFALLLRALSPASLGCRWLGRFLLGWQAGGCPGEMHAPRPALWLCCYLPGLSSDPGPSASQVALALSPPTPTGVLGQLHGLRHTWKS